MRDFYLFALDAFSTNRRRFLLTVAIIAIGVASLVGIETAVDVLTSQVVGSFDKLGAGLLTIRPRPDAPPIGFRQAYAFRHSGHDPASHVTVWTPMQDAAIVRGGGRTTDPVVHVLAVDESYLLVQGLRLAGGRHFSPYEVEGHSPVALLGDNVRRRLYGESDGLGEMVSVDGLRLQVIGVLERQGAVFGTGLDDALLMPISSSAEDCQITLRAAQGHLHPAMLQAGSRMATIRRLPLGAEPDFEIVEADGAASTLASLRSNLSLAALAIGLVTMLGAAVGLMNSLLVSVKERTREIGTRRALGARARDIARQFLAEALLIGLLGSAAGVALGLLLGNLVALSLEGCFTAPWGWMAAGVLLAAVVSLSSGLLPARRAARLDPIEALRSL